MRTKAPGRHEILRKYEPIFLSGEKSRRSLVRLLKQESPTIIRAVLSQGAGPYRPDVVITESIRRHFDDLMIKIPTEYTGQLNRELNWLAGIVLARASQIIPFLEVSRQIAQAVICGDHSRGETILSEASTYLGYSLWYLENKLLLADLRGGLATNREELQRIRENSNRRLIHIMADQFSRRAESGITDAAFVAGFNTRFQRWKDARSLREISFVRCCVDFRTFIIYQHLPFVLWRSTALALVDQYEILIRCLQFLVARREPEAQEHVREVVLVLERVIPDGRLRVLRALIDGGDAAPDCDSRLSEVLDSYTTGDYDRAYRASVDAIKNHPDVLEYYEICARAAHFLDRREEISDSGAILPHLIRAVGQVLERGPDALAASEILRNASVRLAHLPLGLQLYHLARSVKSPSNDAEQFRSAFATVVSPRLSNFAANSRSLLNNLRNAGLAPLTTEVFEYIHDVSVDCPALPPYRQLTSDADRAMRKRNYEEAIGIYQRILHNWPTDGALYWKATEGIFSANMAMKQWSECAELALSLAAERYDILRSLPLGKLFDAAKSANVEESAPIEWALIHHLASDVGQCGRDTEILSILVEIAVSRYGQQKPSQLLACNDTLPRLRVALFLHRVCTIDVLERTVIFTSTDDIEHERILICQSVQSIEPGINTAEEIYNLSRSTQIRRSLRHLSQAKIALGHQLLLAALESEYAEVLERLRILLELSDRQRGAARVTTLEFAPATEDVESTDAARLLLEEHFESTRMQFLINNEYGLDSCLSIRIRHGTLMGQLRSVFEREHLVTTRSEKDNVYGKNIFWLRSLKQQRSIKENEVTRIFQLFSKQIDELITEVRDKWIQIKGPEHPDGLFDFEFSRRVIDDVVDRGLTAKSGSELVQTTVGTLLRRSEAMLPWISDVITSNLDKNFDALLHNLRERLQRVIPDFEQTELAQAVLRCGTAVQNELAEVADWFNFSGALTIEDYDVGVLVDVVAARIERCFPEAPLSITRNLQANVLFRGDSFIALSDVLFIILENVVKHMESSNPKVTLRVCRTDSCCVIEASNSLPTSVVADSIKARLTAILSELVQNDTAAATRREGGTGLHKIKKLIRADLGVDFCDIHPYIKDGTYSIVLSFNCETICLNNC